MAYTLFQTTCTVVQTFISVYVIFIFISKIKNILYYLTTEILCITGHHGFISLTNADKHYHKLRLRYHVKRSQSTHKN